MKHSTVSGARLDGDLDNGIISHEYAHGISNRLTGGSANGECLQTTEAGGMGEGWSDWYSLVFTAKPTDVAADLNPSGTYVLGQPSNGSGIRRFPYTTNQAVDPLTYDDIDAGQADVPCPNGCSEVHNVGEIWTSTLWDLYWNLVNRDGFNANLYTGTGGNNLALKQQQVDKARKIGVGLNKLEDLKDFVGCEAVDVIDHHKQWLWQSRE